MPELRLQQSLVDERFEIVERLGQGSYAEIFVARDHSDEERPVVIKALNTSLQGTPDPELELTLIENFQNEAIALDRVRHPHVILRMGHGTAADLRQVPFHYLVLEYMPGGDLLQLCRSRPGNRLRLAEALSYFRQVCEALAYAHQQGIIHRDLKPNNLLVSADHQVLKIADFGVAKMTTGEDTEITRVGAGIYAPPEHHPDEPDGGGVTTTSRRLTAAADIYSLAKTFYTVVCGRAPSQFVRRPITSLPADVEDEPWAGALLRVLERATAQRVEDRYASVVAFWSDLAGVASAAPEEAETEEETRVRPRLRIDRGDVPMTPEQPAFNPVLASVRVSSGQGREPLDAVPGVTLTEERSAKIVVPIGRAPTPLEKPASRQTAKAPEKIATARVSLSEALTTTIRKRVFILLLGIAFVGLLASVYHYARAVVPPKAIEVMTVNLNVRAGPSYQYPVLGTVTKGSRHRVLGQADNGWLRIEVNSWNESLPHDQAQKEGWVSGRDEYVSIAERRWW
jgi:serine/threonine protein kinase